MPTLQAFSVRNESPDLLELDVYDVIGESYWGDAVSAKSVRKQLKQSAAKVIKVRINSGGGDAFDGIAISNDLLNHSAKVEVDVTGIAASAASIIAMAGDTITVADNALMMIHEAWTIAMGGKADMQSVVNELERVNQNIAATYEKASKKRGKNVSKAEFLKLMAETSWLTAEEAVNLGLADQQTKAKAKIAASLWSPVMSRGQLHPSAARAILAGMKDHLEELDPDEIERLKASAGGDQATDLAPEPPASLARNDHTNATPGGPTQVPSAQLELPSVQPTPVAGGNNHSTTETPAMSDNDNNKKNDQASPSVARALGLPAGAPESEIVAAAARCRELEIQITTITDSKSSSEAIGAVREFVAAAGRVKDLEARLAKVEGERDEQNFDAEVNRGLAERKLTPAEAKHERECFDRAKAEGRGAARVEELRGRLKVAAPRIGAALREPAKLDRGAAPVLEANGQKYEDMTYAQRARLSKDDPELYRAMKSDYDERRKSA